MPYASSRSDPLARAPLAGWHTILKGMVYPPLRSVWYGNIRPRSPHRAPSGCPSNWDDRWGYQGMRPFKHASCGLRSHCSQRPAGQCWSISLTMPPLLQTPPHPWSARLASRPLPRIRVILICCGLLCNGRLPNSARGTISQ